MNNFGENLKLARKEKGLSCERLAVSANRKFGTTITKSTIFRWEKGETQPRASNLVAITKILDVSIDELYRHEF
ncbi:MAG: helix-turn-helix transcriptional regulator [Eubacterium sp.]